MDWSLLSVCTKDSLINTSRWCALWKEWKRIDATGIYICFENPGRSRIKLNFNLSATQQRKGIPGRSFLCVCMCIQWTFFIWACEIVVALHRHRDLLWMPKAKDEVCFTAYRHFPTLFQVTITSKESECSFIIIA